MNIFNIVHININSLMKLLSSYILMKILIIKNLIKIAGYIFT